MQKMDTFTTSKAYAAEVLRDLFNTPLLDSCTDLETWAPIDVETRRCLNRLHDRDVDAEPPKEQWLRELQGVYKRGIDLWPGTIMHQTVAPLGLHDVRGQLVEFDRYLEAYVGRPVRYHFHPRG